MKKIFKALFLALGMTVGLTATSCSSDEDTTPSLADTNGFAPADDDNSEEANLRRAFAKEVGSYLLFNDTLTKQQVSVDVNGKPVYKVETVDINYVMMGSSDDTYKYTYKYLANADKQKAADAYKRTLGKKLGNINPYSVLLVDTINKWKNSDGVYILKGQASYLLGERCYIFSMNGGKAYTDDTYFDDMFEDILCDVFINKSALLADYWSPVEKLIGKYKDDLGYDLGKSNDLARSLGFLYDWNKWYFCTKKANDLADYVHAVCTYSEEEFEEEFAGYPICIKRFKALRNAILSEGVQLDK